MGRARKDADGRFRSEKIESAQTIYKQISINHHPQFPCLSRLTWVSDQCFCGFSSGTSPESSFIVETAVHSVVALSFPMCTPMDGAGKPQHSPPSCFCTGVHLRSSGDWNNWP